MSKSQTPEPGSERTLRSSVRNPRRRQRESDSLKMAPRRKRSKISGDMFVPRHDGDMNGSVVMNGDAHGSRGRKNSTPLMEVDIPVRGKKNVVKRTTRGDGATVLTQNANYNAKLLPSTPKELRRPGTEYRGSLSTATSQALAVTHEHAYIWDYTSHTSVGNPRVFDVPSPARHDEPLPFGALVTSGTSTDMGLVLISAVTGKVVFHESIDRASSLSLFHERNAGVEGTLGSLIGSETVVDIISADSAGFVVLLSSGRIVQLTLRDAQGKARVFAQLLRSSEQSCGGWFGSVKGLLGAGAWKQGTVAVRTRALPVRGQMQVLAVSERAEVRIWDIDWSGRYEYKSKVDFREFLVEELKGILEPEMQGQVSDTAVLDCAIVERPSARPSTEVATPGTERPIDLMFLIRLGSAATQSYALVDASLAGVSVDIRQINRIASYRGQPGSQKPCLLLPKPGHTAYVVFKDAVTLVATSQPETESPDAQLHASYIVPEGFEDTVYLRPDRDLAFLGACEEDSRSGQATCVAFVKSAGLVRFSAADATSNEELLRIPAKSRLKQAVFCGMLQDNIFDLTKNGRDAYQPQEIEEAALAISDELLRSETEQILVGTSSVESHLARNSDALHALARHLRQHFPPLSISTMWRLLWDAERVAAAQQVWKTYEKHLAACTKGRRRETLVEEVAKWYQSGFPLESLDGTGEDDLVRRMFIKGLSRLDNMLTFSRDIIAATLDHGAQPPDEILRLLLEGNELWLSCLEAVFTFRVENAGVYGIDPDTLDQGVLRHCADYITVPEFWTSTDSMLKAIKWITNTSRTESTKVYETESNIPAVAPYVKKLAADNPRLIEYYCILYQERIGWCGSRKNERYMEVARKLEHHFQEIRHEQFRALAEPGQAEAGMRLAEKYRDMKTLTELVIGEAQYMRESLATADEHERVEIARQMTDLEARITRYFDRFGDDFANAFFDEGLSSSRAGYVFSEAQRNWTQHLTRYLRNDRSRAKMCWINDVTAENDFLHAAATLDDVAKDQETKLWSKRVELSLSKLALLAAQEAGQIPDELGLNVLPEHGLKLVRVQEQLYKHLLPEIVVGIDRQAELDVAMEKFGNRSKQLNSHRQLLELSLGKVLDHQALSIHELVDVLTLMDPVWVQQVEEEDDKPGQEIYLALDALDATTPILPRAQIDMLRRVVWKRCFLVDDWVAINASGKKSSDADVRERLIETACYRTLIHGFHASLMSDTDSFRPISPSDCLGAGCAPEDLRDRFSDDEILDPMLQDNRRQDEQLQAYITDRRLDSWFEQCEEQARNAVLQQMDQVAAKNARLRDYEASLTRPGVNGNGVNGHANGMNGIKIEELAEEDGVLGEGEDVEMG